MDHDIPPFALARDRGWTLWELHREKASLEELFRNLTADEPDSGAARDAEVDGGAGRSSPGDEPEVVS